MRDKMLFGFENEYGFTLLDARGNCMQGGADILIAALKKNKVKFVKGGRDIDVFLSNGARFYIDCNHPEYATPECRNPWDVVRHVLAGEAILKDLAATVVAAANNNFAGDLSQYRDYMPPDIHKPLAPRVSRSNVDYLNKTTWGAHESYLVGKDFHGSSLIYQLVPFLATRIIMTGAGGFSPTTAGLRFTMSPRTHYMRAAFGENTTSERTIVNLRKESLAGSTSLYQRLHLICGESLFSETSLWLKAATTAMVVSLTDDGVNMRLGCCGHDHAPAEMKKIAFDASLTHAWDSMTALDIQRHYLAKVRANLEKLPDWASVACDKWAETLEKLESGEASKTIDWAIKYAVFGAQLKKSGFDWGSVGVWNDAIDLLAEHVLSADHKDVYRRSPQPGYDELVHRALTDPSAYPAVVSRKLSDAGIDPNGPLGWRSFMRLRTDMLVLDSKFSEVTGGGVFGALDAAGVLSHSMSVGDVADAKHNPPTYGRAKARGQQIAAIAESAIQYMADWTYILESMNRHSIAELHDPFSEQVSWACGAAYKGICAGCEVRLGRSLMEDPDLLIFRGRNVVVESVCGRTKDGRMVATARGLSGYWLMDEMTVVRPLYDGKFESFDLVQGDMVQMSLYGGCDENVPGGSYGVVRSFSPKNGKIMALVTVILETSGGSTVTHNVHWEIGSLVRRSLPAPYSPDLSGPINVTAVFQITGIPAEFKPNLNMTKFYGALSKVVRVQERDGEKCCVITADGESNWWPAQSLCHVEPIKRTNGAAPTSSTCTLA